MSKQQHTRQNRKSSISDGLDQVADLASAVATSVHGSSPDFEPHEAALKNHASIPNFSNFVNYATYPSNAAVVPMAKLGHQKSSLPNTLTKDKGYRQGSLLGFAELENALSTRRLRFSENSPLLPLHLRPNPERTEAGPGSSRLARLAAGSAILVSVFFLFGLWLSEEIVLAWSKVD